MIEPEPEDGHGEAGDRTLRSPASDVPGSPPPAPEILKAALAALQRKDLTLAELHEALARKGFLPFEAEDTVARLQSWGFVGDERAAFGLVARRQGRRAKGDLALRHELEGRGVPEEIIALALASQEEPDETARARALLQAKYPEGTEPARAARFLTSRGFSEDTIESILASEFELPEP